MNNVENFPKFAKKLFHEHNVSELNLDINKTQTQILMTMDSIKENSMSAISKEVGLEKSSFTRSVEHLVEKGFIKKKILKEDKRVIQLFFTKKGENDVKLIKKHWKNYFNSLISILSFEEKKEFFKSVKIISKYINKII